MTQQILTPLALQNEDTLRSLAARSWTTNAALAADLGRDGSNLSKALAALHDAGLTDAPNFKAKPTDAGVQVLAALDRAAGSDSVTVTRATIAEIPLDLIDTDPLLNPRTTFAEEPLQALAESIRDKGVAQPILLRPGLEAGRYRVVAGERRTRAARLAGLAGIPAMIRDLDDDQALEIATIENIQREDLSPIEEGRAFQRILDAKLRLHPELSAKEAKEIIAAAVRKTVRYVEQRCDLLLLPTKTQERVLIPRGEPNHLSLENARFEVQALRRAEQQAKERILEPADLLVIAELVDASDKRPAKMQNWWYASKVTEVSYELPGDVRFEALRKRQIITFHDDHNRDGRAHAGMGTYAFSKKDLAAQLPGFAGSGRAKALNDLRERVLGVPEAARCRVGGLYATWWLNGPFKVNPALAEKVKKAETARKALETRTANAARAAKAALEAADTAVRELAGTTPGAIHANFVPVLVGIDRPTPWRIDIYGNLFAANGKEIRRHTYSGQPDDQLVALHMLIAAAVNLAAGTPFTVEPDGSSEPAPADDEDELEDAEA